ncbi:MAG: phospho-N-acetylmuramoyl-pentapeptide-transferase [Heliobacteriaceae bacterium]|nr:phospho-N-acetylmuramoyl-pentapeptide-transferase [Heliobacteriaceae bacterium]
MIMITVAFLLGLILCLLFGVPYIDFLQKKMIGQYIKDVAPQTHARKEGTPTTGGVFIIGAVMIAAITTLMLAQKLDTKAFIILLSLMFYTFAGFQDDYLKIKGKGNDGLSAKGKFLRQFVIALLPVLYLLMAEPEATRLSIGGHFFELSWFYPVLALFIITGSSNAFNLTDGLDGLAASSGIPAFAAAAVIAFLSGCPQAAIISAAAAGALLGFLKYNAPKAKVFMGDTGSLAVGGLLGTLAVMCKFELLLIFLGGVFIAETLSVIIQVWSFKTTGKRVFKMSPLHHHFELCGWSEGKIVKAFTAVSALLCTAALLLFYTGGR